MGREYIAGGSLKLRLFSKHRERGARLGDLSGKNPHLASQRTAVFATCAAGAWNQQRRQIGSTEHYSPEPDRRAEYRRQPNQQHGLHFGWSNQYRSGLQFAKLLARY